MVPYANVVPASATGGLSAYAFMRANGWTGFGPQQGYASTTGDMNLFFPSNNALSNALYANNNRISELVGLRRFFVSDRDRRKLRSFADWQATDALSFEVGSDYTGTSTTDAIYGLQRYQTWMTSLDATYALSNTLSASVYYTWEQLESNAAGRTYSGNSNSSSVSGFNGLSGNAGCDSYGTLQQRNNNNKLDPCLDWFDNIRDRVQTTGVSLNRKTAKVEVSGELLFTRARTDNTPTGGNWQNNPLALSGAPAGTIAAFFIPASPLPTVSTDTAEVRVNGRYTVDKHQLVRLVYSYLRMRSVDWMYDGMQFGAGTISGVLPTNEQPFNYGVNVVAASYVMSF